MIGDSVTGPSIDLTATVSGAAASGRSGSWSLVLLRDGQPVQSFPFSGDGTTQSLEVSDGGRYSVEVLRSEGGIDYVEVYSSPVWFTPGPPTFKVGKAKLNKKKGTATIKVDVGNPGSLKLAGKSLAKSSKQASGPGTYKLKVKPKGKLKKKLAKKGKAEGEGSGRLRAAGRQADHAEAKLKLLRK